MEPIKNGSFSYSPTDGFLNNGVPRADKKTLRQYLHPVRPYRQQQTWAPPKVTGKWCKAQLAHYGVKPLMGSRAELEARLRAAHAAGLLAKQPAEVKVMEKYMRKEWRAGCEEWARRVKSEKKDEGDGSGVPVKFEVGAAADVKNESSMDGAGGLQLDGEVPMVDVKKERKQTNTTAFSKKHVLGTWDVSCPDIQANWARTESLTILLFQDIESNSVVGEIIFGAMEGVLKLRTNPSTRNPRVGFDWAGVAGDGGAQAAEKEGEIRFYNRGERAHGRFQCIEGVGRGVEFEAVKVRELPIRGKVDFLRYAAPAGSIPEASTKEK
ncbi:hypothetical protein P167DRAFT_570457 [Morchella conica CCBAS932]|uniref:Uncharacterized protein n=1 Tax=Morchella conica CCBAS932 TaxID=1392247 RepID=A0A3N4L5B3_9PEZI|nr:hypothetical protein P167DRAFT_570457 [Morchella conica CCBAS932]